MDGDLGQLAHVLSLSITPVALVSGVGLLLLSMTNRLGRVIDRSRQLGKDVVTGAPAPGGDAARAEELRILFRRARLIQLAIALIGGSVFLAVLMIGGLFAMSYGRLPLGGVILGMFGVCLLLMSIAMAMFLGDIFLSIRSLHLTVGRFVDGGPDQK